MLSGQWWMPNCRRIPKTLPTTVTQISEGFIITNGIALRIKKKKRWGVGISYKMLTMLFASGNNYSTQAC